MKKICILVLLFLGVVLFVNNTEESINNQDLDMLLKVSSANAEDPPTGANWDVRYVKSDGYGGVFVKYCNPGGSKSC